MIALDLDNTIICYDEAFRTAASLLACLPAVGTPINKSSIKAAALAKGGNDLWTRLQGLVYGEQIGMATLYPGCADFVAASREEIVILSHKTQFPVLGSRSDLRKAATTWLESTPLANLPLHFFDTREAKVAAIAALSPRAIIDDLPEVFLTPGFPSSTSFFLFDPVQAHADWSFTPRVISWSNAGDQILTPKK